MVNAGALATTELVKGADPDEQFDRLLVRGETHARDEGDHDAGRQHHQHHHHQGHDLDRAGKVQQARQPSLMVVHLGARRQHLKAGAEGAEIRWIGGIEGDGDEARQRQVAG